jgi:hypothetical protein
LPDLNKAIQNHHHQMEKWWAKPEYVKERIAFVKRNPICKRCGRPTTTPGHSHEDYKSFNTYLSAVIRDVCVPLCNACNFQERKGRKPCPVCVKLKSNKIYYIGDNAEYCYHHRPEEEVRRSEERKEVYKMLIERGKKIRNAKQRKIYQEMKLVGNNHSKR